MAVSKRDLKRSLKKVIFRTKGEICGFFLTKNEIYRFFVQCTKIVDFSYNVRNLSIFRTMYDNYRLYIYLFIYK